MGETYDSGAAHLVSQHYPNRNEMYYLGISPQMKRGHPVDRLARGTVEGS